MFQTVTLVCKTLYGGSKTIVRGRDYAIYGLDRSKIKAKIVSDLTVLNLETIKKIIYSILRPFYLCLLYVQP
jgi:hypothetical protein